MLHTGSAVLVSLLLSGFVGAFYTNGTRIHQRFKIDKDDVQTGQVYIGGVAIGAKATSEQPPPMSPEEVQRTILELQRRLDGRGDSDAGATPETKRRPSAPSRPTFLGGISRSLSKDRSLA